MHRTVGIVVVTALALASCRKPRGDDDDSMRAFEGFVDRMSGCNDKACANHVQEAWEAWSAEMARTADRRR